MRKLLFLSALALLLSGCASGYEQFFNPIDTTNFIPLKEGEEPELLKSNNIQEDSISLIEKNYALLGVSGFTSALEDIQGAIDKAKELRATLVLYEIKNPQQITRTSVKAMPNTQTTYFSGGSLGSSYSGTATNYGASHIPITTSVTRYEQIAYYFSKRKTPVRLGLMCDDIPTELRIKYDMQSVFVLAVIEGSPAHHANFKRGDIITNIAGIKISNKDGMDNVLKNIPLGDKSVPFDIIRDEKKLTITVHLTQ